MAARLLRKITLAERDICATPFYANLLFTQIVILRKCHFYANIYFTQMAILRKWLFYANLHFTPIFILRKWPFYTIVHFTQMSILRKCLFPQASSNRISDHYFKYYIRYLERWSITKHEKLFDSNAGNMCSLQPSFSRNEMLSNNVNEV